MSRTYKATGINLKSMPLGEADRVLTILTREQGLIRAVAMGARKQNSKLGGRSGLFVVNTLLIAKGRSLDKITQAETLESYPGLARNLEKLTASQYLAELVLQQALSEQPQEELFYLLNEHLARLERSSTDQVLPRLTHAVFQLLVLAGIAPQVHQCSVSQTALVPNCDDPEWRAGFSVAAGGAVTLAVLEQLQTQAKPVLTRKVQSATGQYAGATAATSPPAGGQSTPAGSPQSAYALKSIGLNVSLNAVELSLMQQLAHAELPFADTLSPLPASRSDQAWLEIERLLRQYAQYHFDRPIRSATLIDRCFSPSITPKGELLRNAPEPSSES